MTESKLVALDTSHWVSWMNDVFSPDQEVRQTAHGFFHDLLQLGYTILLSGHHLLELMAIDDEELVSARLRFIQDIPLLSWIDGSNEDGIPGTIVDVAATEVLVAYRGGGDASAVRREAKPILLRTGSGRDLVPDDPFILSIIRLWSQQSFDQARTITAISPIEFIDPKKRLGDLFSGKIRSLEEATPHLLAQQQKIETEIKEHGDRRIADPKKRAGAFISEVAGSARDLPSTPREFVLQTLAEQGIDQDEVDEWTTMEEVQELVHFRGQLRAVARRTGVPFELLKRKVKVAQLPHKLIDEALLRFGQQHNERKGSDLVDRRLAALAPYADVTYVDKRTAENFRRAIQKKPKLGTLIGKIEKASDYRTIPSALRGMN